MTGAELDNLGEEIFRLKNQTRLKLGYNPDHLTFADRYFETPALGQELSRGSLHDMVGLYRNLTGL